MTSNIEFKTTENPAVIRKLYLLCGTEWSGLLTPEKFADKVTKTHIEYVKMEVR